MILQERTTTELLLARSYWERARTCTTVGGLATYYCLVAKQSVGKRSLCVDNTNVFISFRLRSRPAGCSMHACSDQPHKFVKPGRLRFLLDSTFVPQSTTLERVSTSNQLMNKMQIAMLLCLIFILGIFATTGHSYPQRYISKYGGTCSNIPTSSLGPHASVVLDS